MEKLNSYRKVSATAQSLKGNIIELGESQGGRRQGSLGNLVESPGDSSQPLATQAAEHQRMLYQHLVSDGGTVNSILSTTCRHCKYTECASVVCTYAFCICTVSLKVPEIVPACS